MATFRYDPYLWVHLAGLATVPLWLAICGLGLAVGSPSAPWLEQGMIGLIGVLPILLMQWLRPFCIFSLMALALKPAAMTEDQRRILSLFRQRWVSLVALLVPIPLVWLLLQIYPIAVMAADLTPFSGWGRSGGLAIASGSFLMANLFAQVPASVLVVMTTPAQKFASTPAYPLEQIPLDFTQIGLPVRRILPAILPLGETGSNRVFSEPSIPSMEIPETQALGHDLPDLSHGEGLAHPEDLPPETNLSAGVATDGDDTDGDDTDIDTDDDNAIEIPFLSGDELGDLATEAAANQVIAQRTATDLEASHSDIIPTAAAIHPEVIHPDGIHPEVIHPEVIHPEVIHPETDHELVAFSASAPDGDNPTGSEEEFQPQTQPIEIAVVRISDPKPLPNPDSDARTE
jgi:hypothetical protein